MISSLDGHGKDVSKRARLPETKRIWTPGAQNEVVYHLRTTSWFWWRSSAGSCLMLQRHHAEIPPSWRLHCLAAEGFWRAEVTFATHDLLHPEPGHCTALRAPATSSHSVPTLRGHGGSPRVTWTENAAALMAFEDLQSVLTPPPHGDHLSVICWSTRAMMSLLINKAQHLVLLLCNYLLWIMLLSSLVLLWLSS